MSGATLKKIGTTASSNIGDNRVVRGDGGLKGIQGSGVIVDDSDNMSGINILSVVDDATTRTNLGLGTISTQNSNSVSITGGSITGITELGTISSQDSDSVSITGGSVTGITDIAVADGGSGRGTATAYAVVCGGTTATAAQQSIASAGVAGQLLTSNGAAALPTFQDAGGGGGGNFLQVGILNSANYAYPGHNFISSFSTIGVTDQRLYLIPTAFSESFTIAKLYFEVTTANAGSQARVGIYEFVDTGTFTLVGDYGTVSTATTGIKSVTANEAVTPNNRYYFAITIDENAGAVSCRSATTLAPVIDISGASFLACTNFQKASVDPASSLPATVVVATGQSVTYPLVLAGKV